MSFLADEQHVAEEQHVCWALKAIVCLCEARPDLAEVVKTRAAKESGMLRAALFYCAHPADSVPVFDAFGDLLEMTPDKRREVLPLIRELEVSWIGHEALFVQLLRLRDTQLAVALTAEWGLDWTIGELNIGPIDWWLDWLSEEPDEESTYWLRYRLAQLFARFVDARARQSFVTEFNKSDSRFRRLLAHHVLPHFSDLSTEVFSENAVSFLLTDLNHYEGSPGWQENLLGSTATEEFVTERLLSLLPDATKPPLSKNLRRVLRQAGSRHGRRYFSE